MVHFSIEEEWSELHSFENIIWQTAGRGLCAKTQREDGRMVVEDDVEEGTVHMHSAAPITASPEGVPAFNPTMRPSGVITPDVNPKLKPVMNDCFIITVQCRCASAPQDVSMMALRSLPLITS